MVLRKVVDLVDDLHPASLREQLYRARQPRVFAKSDIVRVEHVNALSPQDAPELARGPPVAHRARGARRRVQRDVPDAFSLEDLNSSNGTLVNGKPTRSAPLHNGDIIQVGSFSLHVAFAERPDPAHASRILQKSEEQTVAMPTQPPAPRAGPDKTPSAAI